MLHALRRLRNALTTPGTVEEAADREVRRWLGEACRATTPAEMRRALSVVGQQAALRGTEVRREEVEALLVRIRRSLAKLARGAAESDEHMAALFVAGQDLLELDILQTADIELLYNLLCHDWSSYGLAVRMALHPSTPEWVRTKLELRGDVHEELCRTARSADEERRLFRAWSYAYPFPAAQLAGSLVHLRASDLTDLLDGPDPDARLLAITLLPRLVVRERNERRTMR